MPSLTPEDIGNMALAMLTEAPIVSFDDDNKAARLCKLHFDTTVEAELTLHPWGFAAVFPDDLEATDTGRDDEFQYLYEVPADFLRPLWMTTNGTWNGVPFKWTYWGDGIRSDFEGPLTMPYVGYVQDPADWPALFVRAVAAALAIPIAHPLTGKANMVQIAQATYDRAIADARRVNAIMRFGQAPDTSWAIQRGDYRNARP